MMFENVKIFNIVKLSCQNFEIVKMGLLNPIFYYWFIYIYIACVNIGRNSKHMCIVLGKNKRTPFIINEIITMSLITKHEIL
jgi:hypothetical protein